ncbi:MAG: hypothetical protein JEZ05_04155 [Tenericutes bacterium]|nr:hypothetical protein [Mycoplasmatota bacterium]
MKRKMLMICTLFLSLFLVSCSNGISMGGGITSGYEFPGYIQIQLDEEEYDVKETILLHVSYGHDYIENFNENNLVLGHRISVYTIDGSYSGNFDNPTEFIEFFEVSYEGEDLGSDVYRCYPGMTIFSKVEYNMTIDLDLDITEIDYDYGLLVIRFEEDFVNQNNIDGEIIENQDVHYIYSFIYFLKDDTIIQFSKKSFA